MININIPSKTTSDKLWFSSAGKMTYVIKKSSGGGCVYEYTVHPATNALCRLVMYGDDGTRLDIQIPETGKVKTRVRTPARNTWVDVDEVQAFCEHVAVKPGAVQVVVPSAHGTHVRTDKDGKMIVYVEVPVLAVEPFEEGKLLLTIGSNLDEFKSPTSSSAPPTAEQS